MDENKIKGNGKRRPAGLLFFEGQEKPRQYVIFKEALIKGQCDMEVFTTASLQLEYDFLDPETGRIWTENGSWFYENLSEDVFSFVGGTLLEKGQCVELTDGTVLRLSNGGMLTAIFFSEFVSGRDWQIINLDDGRHTVDIKNQTEETGKAAISLQYESGYWTIQDFQAKNVLHNGEPAADGFKITIDDNITIGDTRFFFEGAGLVYGYPLQESSLSINIDERSAHTALKKVTLLKDINLSVEPGNMVLILGGSGAGKSTFVNAVTGYEKAKATIREGDLDYYRDYGQVKHRIGFVPQENLMREDDTVGDTVSNAAQMRLPADMPESEKKKRIAAVLETFGLSGREKELVSKLSGGQKKRLSICMEFIASPSLFILDEPDSGLDGIMATELMENLRLIACQGRIVMVITHSPDRVAHLFDKVIVLAKSTEDKVGQLAFYGGIQEARDFFGVPTMEDVVKRINARNEGGEGRSDEFIEKYREYEKTRAGVESEVYADAAGIREEKREREAGAPGGASGARYRSRLEQIPVYLGKQFRMMFTEKNWKVFIMAAVIAYLVVYVLGSRMFRNMEYTKYGSLALIMVCIWNGMFNSIQVVCKERSIIKREHRAGLHISSYLAAHMIYQALICLIQVIITLLIFRAFGMYFPKTGLITGSFAVDVCISMFLATYAADMLALMVSCIAHSTTGAMTIMPFLMVVQLVFAGGVFPINRPMAKQISKVTISNWGINAVNIAADYNGQNSTVLYAAIEQMSHDNLALDRKGFMDGIPIDEAGQVIENAEGSVQNEAELEEDTASIMDKLIRVLQISEVREKVQRYTAAKMQVAEYAYTRANLLGCWGILALFCAVYILVGLVFLEMIDKDKR